MKNRKINVDRPQLRADEIMAGKDFESVVRNHQFMSKPFYKQGWFFGTTGLASLGLIIGGTLAFQSSDNQKQTASAMLNTDAPPNLAVPDNKLIVENVKYRHETNDLVNKTIAINPLNISPIEETATLENLSETEKPLTDKVNISDGPIGNAVLGTMEDDITKEDNSVADQTEDKSNSMFDLSPRISNKIGGSITRNELLDNKGITTEGDINIIHFELHLIDGLGGKVFAEESNQLNQEMKDALENVGPGETIYFENIRGKVKSGGEVRLNPMRYVLMN